MLRRSLLVAGLALTFATCRDSFEPGASARIAVSPVLPASSELADFGLSIDGVRFIVVRPFADTLADTTVVLPPDVMELAIDIRIPILTRHDTVSVSVVALSGTLPLFAGTELVPVPTPLPPPEIALDLYVGPPADSIVIQPSDTFLITGDSLRFQAHAFNGGVPVSQFYVSWSTSDTMVARISPQGVLRAPLSRSAVEVRARMPSGAADSVTARFTPPATSLVLIAGEGQTDTVGSSLSLPLEVEARANDGLGVGGVAVRFRTVAGGGSVADTIVITDTLGRARTIATLGSLLGVQSFEASATGLGSPVLFSAAALAGPPAQLLAAAGDAQLAIVNTVLAVAPSVVVRDGGGNPVAGVPVTFTVTGGGGGVTGGSDTTDASGVATAGAWTLGTLAGTNTLLASGAGLSRTFTATGIAAAPAQLVAIAGDLQSALVGALVAIDPAVRVQDQFGNPVAGASVTFGVSGGGGSVSGAQQLTNAAGVATVGSWGLGMLAGANGLTASLGSLTPVTFTATALAGVATTISKIAGDLQSGIVNTLLGAAPAVRLEDQFGNPVSGASVTFNVTGGGGSLLGAAQITDAAGVATLGSWTLGTGVGANTLQATAGSLSADFIADALAGLPKQIGALLGDGQSGLVGALLAIAPAVVVRDSFNNPVPGVPVTFTPSLGGLVTGDTTTTDSAGKAQIGSWQLATLAGTNTLTAATGAGQSVGFTATGLAGAATQLLKASVDSLTSVVGQLVGAAPALKALDQFGNPVSGETVTFLVTAGGGIISGGSPVTNAAGIATLGGWSLGTLAGANSVAGAVGADTASFTAFGIADVPALLEEVSGDGQIAVVNTALTQTPVVRLVDQYGNPIAGVPVLFDILVDGGALGDTLPVTDAAGFASPGSWTIADFVTTNLLQASSAGVPAVQFSALAIPDIPWQMLLASVDTQTALVGQSVSVQPAVVVRDTFFNPVPGVGVTFGILSGGGLVTPTTAITDGDGVARVTSWILGTLVGLNELEASVPGLSGSPITFSANGITTTATNMALFAGDVQSGVVATALADSYAVRVLDAGGAPVQSVLVHWAVDSLGGVMSPTTSLTDLNGVATSSRILGQVAGPQTVFATVNGLQGSPVLFSATALPHLPFQILKRSPDQQTGIVASLVTAPVVEVVDQFDNPVPDVPVNFALAGLGLLGTTLDTTDAAGLATTGSWLLGDLLGVSTVTATVVGLADAVFTATAIADLAFRVTEDGGNGQTGTAGQALPLPYRVRVVDLLGNPVRQITVTWSVAPGNGSIPATVSTDSNGVSAAFHTLGTTVGPQVAIATVSGLLDSTVTFTSTATAGAATAILKDGGDQQTAIVNTAVAIAPTVKVTDQSGAPVAGHSVTWTVTSGGGSLGSPTTVQTNTAGIATAPGWTLGTAAGSNGLTASSVGLTGTPVPFTATGRAGPATQMAISAGNGQSAIVGATLPVKPAVILKDLFNNPVPDAQVTFNVITGGGTITGTPATSNAQGIAIAGTWTLGTIAGSNTLRATSLGVPAVTFGATGLAGAPVQLTFITAPERPLAGQIIDPPVRVVFQDAFGNTNFQVNDVVSLGLGTVPVQGAKLVGTTDVPAVNGVAVFDNVLIDSAGAGFTLVAQTPKIPDVLFPTQPFDVGGVAGSFLFDGLDPVDAVFEPSTRLIFVPGQARMLGVIDPSKGERTQFPVQSPGFAAGVNSQTSQVFVTTGVNSVQIFDARDPATPLGEIPLQGLPRGIAVDEANDLVFVAVEGDLEKGTPPALVIISGQERSVVDTIFFQEGTPAGFGVAFDQRDTVYVAIPNLGVAVFALSKLEHVTTISIVGEKGAAGTFDVAFDPRTNLVYATNRSDSSLSIIRPSELKEIDRVRVGHAPEGIGVDPDRGMVYVANSGSNTLSFLTVDPETARLIVIATLAVGPTPKAAAVDPGTGRVYVPTFGDDRVVVVQP